MAGDSSIESLRTRLRRLEYALTGSTSDSEQQITSDNRSVPAQIDALNVSLAKLANQSKSVRRLLHACDAQPSLLEDTRNPVDHTSTLSEKEKLAIILPSAPIYHQTSSLLVGIRDTPFPEETTSAEMANYLPEIIKLHVQYVEWEKRTASLASRTAKVLQMWYEITEGFNACVAEFDERLRDLEIRIARKERTIREADVY